MPITARTYVRTSRAAAWSRRIGALALPILVLAAIGHRTGAIPTEALVPVLNAGIGCGLLAAFLATFAFFDIWASGAQGFRNAVIGFIYAVPALALIGAAGVGVLLYPRLTDVSTDLVDIPEVTGITPAEESDEARALQAAAYPDLVARFYPVTLDRAFNAVRTLVEDRGWEVTDVVPPPPPEPLVPAAPAGETLAGTVAPVPEAAPPPDSALPARASIEAIARTFLFAFPDHVVVRLTETGQGTRVDMRSLSEIGAHDLGQNARRILGFMADIDAVLQGMEDAGPAEDAGGSAPGPALPAPRPAR